MSLVHGTLELQVAVNIDDMFNLNVCVKPMFTLEVSVYDHVYTRVLCIWPCLHQRSLYMPMFKPWFSVYGQVYTRGSIGVVAK